MNLWEWWRNRRRNKVLKRPFPKKWISYLLNNLHFYVYLLPGEQKKLQNDIQIFISEKDWYGCNDLEINDEIQVTIAAHACLLILNIPHDYYRNVTSIYVYPTTVISPEQKLGFFEIPTSPIHGPMPILGEAHFNGPVILVWDTLKKEARHPEKGHNIVFHEFAHKLDMMDGLADGTPSLVNKDEYQRWVEVCTDEFNKLKKKLLRNEVTFLDEYAAENEAEFFAVITEHFFTKPKKFKCHHSKLYEVLKSFYNQDPELVTRSK